MFAGGGQIPLFPPPLLPPKLIESGGGGNRVLFRGFVFISTDQHGFLLLGFLASHLCGFTLHVPPSPASSLIVTQRTEEAPPPGPPPRHPKRGLWRRPPTPEADLLHVEGTPDTGFVVWELDQEGFNCGLYPRPGPPLMPG